MDVLCWGLLNLSGLSLALRRLSLSQQRLESEGLLLDLIMSFDLCLRLSHLSLSLRQKFKRQYQRLTLRLI